MCENNTNFHDYSGYNCHSSSESCCSSENNFYFKIDDTLNEKYLNLSKKFDCQLTSINKELNRLKLLIILLIIYIMCHRRN